MKPQTLRALFTDHALGELDPMTAELLEAFASRDPVAAEIRREVETVLGAASEALARHPELSAHHEEVRPPVLPRHSPSAVSVWRRAAAVLLLAAGMGGAGYWAGQRNISQASSQADAASAQSRTATRQIAWKQYRVAYNAETGRYQLQ